MIEGELKVNGEVVPLNPQMSETLFKTIAGFTGALRGVEGPVKSIQIDLTMD